MAEEPDVGRDVTGFVKDANEILQNQIKRSRHTLKASG